MTLKEWFFLDEVITHCYKKKTTKAEAERTMGIFDDVNKAMKQAQDELKKADIDKQFKELEQNLSKAGKDLSQEAGKVRGPATQPAGQKSAMPVQAPQNPAAGATGKPHKGYAKLTGWIKTRYSSRISGISDPRQKKLVFDQVTTDACSGLPEKTKKGFLDYLKNQNIEQLLK